VYYCDESKRSCAEIVFQLLQVSKARASREVGLALLAGMLTDSGHFKFATPSLLRTFGEIMESHHIEIDEVYDMVDLEQDISERISQLRGAQRMSSRGSGTGWWPSRGERLRVLGVQGSWHGRDIAVGSQRAVQGERPLAGRKAWDCTWAAAGGYRDGDDGGGHRRCWSDGSGGCRGHPQYMHVEGLDSSGKKH
jgi:hypothetical protein